MLGWTLRDIVTLIMSAVLGHLHGSDFMMGPDQQTNPRTGALDVAISLKAAHRKRTRFGLPTLLSDVKEPGVGER